MSRTTKPAKASKPSKATKPAKASKPSKVAPTKSAPARKTPGIVVGYNFNKDVKQKYVLPNMRPMSKKPRKEYTRALLLFNRSPTKKGAVIVFGLWENGDFTVCTNVGTRTASTYGNQIVGWCLTSDVLIEV